MIWYYLSLSLSIPIIFQGISVLRPSFLAIHAKLAKKNISTFWGFEPGTNFCKNSNAGLNFAVAIVAVNPPDPPSLPTVAIFLYTASAQREPRGRSPSSPPAPTRPRPAAPTS